jgi:hypothetical protein
MAHFEFLQISWDYGKEFLSLEDNPHEYYEGESWEQALELYLYKMSDDWLESLEDIYRASNDKIVSCREKIEAEIFRRTEDEKLKELMKAEAEERALYEKLAAKFAPKE